MRQDSKVLSLWIEASNGADRLFLSELMRRGFTTSLDEDGDLTLNFRTEEDIARQEVEALLR
jgi:hypothetical protein